MDLPPLGGDCGSALGAPGIGIAGFVCSLLGISLIGLVLSWVGYRQAVRQGRPTGLCMAGVIIGVAWMLLGAAATIWVVAMTSQFSH